MPPSHRERVRVRASGGYARPLSASSPALSCWERVLRRSGPVHAIQHDLLKRWGLKTPRIMAEQQHKDVALTILARPPQGKGASWHVLWLSFWPPGMRALRRVSRNK